VRRQLVQDLISWRGSPSRKPLIVQGARQVGKTFLLQAFGSESFDNVAYLNFEAQPELASIFERELIPAKIIRKIEIALAQKISVSSTLIILDEIQACSTALTSLKYFAEQAPQYHVVAAGSQLGINIGAKSSFPVGKVELLSLYPLSFFEFLEALDKQGLLELISKESKLEAIEEIFHAELLDLLNLYFYIGGMPECVQRFIDTNDLHEVRLVQERIIHSYIADFSKHAEDTQTLKIRRIWDSVPSQLSRENKKFIFSAVAKSARAREYETALHWLFDAGLLLESRLVADPRVPLKAFASPDAFKVFALDIGLLGAMVKLDQSQVVLSKDLYFQFRGALVENFVAQELMASGLSPLYYWADGARAEVDFLIDFKSKIIAIEAKSGHRKGSKSLQRLMEHGKIAIAVRVSKDPAMLTDRHCDLPLYQLGALGGIIEELLSP